MESSDQNIFVELKKKFYRSTYSDKYGGSIFSTFFILTSITLLIIYYQLMKNASDIRADWTNQRCSPRVLPFAGQINAPPGTSQFDYTAENFTYCVNNIVEDTGKMAIMPINWIISIVINTLKMVMEAVNKIRAYISGLRVMLMNILSEIYQKILTVVIPIQQTMITLLDLMGKLNGIFQTTLGQAEGGYNVLASSIGAMHEFIVIILLILAAIIMVLWAIPVTWGAAAAMTAIFIMIMIPLSIIAIWMDIIFSLSGSKIPSPPSCFDENTKIMTQNNKSINIKDIQVGTKLYDGSIVTGKMKMSAYGHDMYKLDNIIVSGDHRMLFRNKLIKVKEHPEAYQIKYNKLFIYCLNTSSKHIVIDNYKFTDYDDLDKKEINELKYMFSDFNTTDLHDKYEGGMSKDTKIKLLNGDEKYIDELSIYDKLPNGEIVLGLVEIDGNVNKYKYHLHNLEITAGNNLSFYDSNLGIIRNISNSLLKEKIHHNNEKLYSIVTNTGYFTIDNYKFYDYNGVLDAFLKKEHTKIIKNILK